MQWQQDPAAGNTCQPGTPEPRRSPKNPVGSIGGCPRKPLEEEESGPRKEHLMDPTPVWAAMALGSKIPDWFSYCKLFLSVAEIKLSSQTQMHKKCSPIFCMCFHSIPAPIPLGGAPRKNPGPCFIPKPRFRGQITCNSMDPRSKHTLVLTDISLCRERLPAVRPLLFWGHLSDLWAPLWGAGVTSLSWSSRDLPKSSAVTIRLFLLSSIATSLG